MQALANERVRKESPRITRIHNFIFLLENIDSPNVYKRIQIRLVYVKGLMTTTLSRAGIDRRSIHIGYIKDQEVGGMEVKHTILIVDDERGSRESLKMILTPHYRIKDGGRGSAGPTNHPKKKIHVVRLI